MDNTKDTNDVLRLIYPQWQGMGKSLFPLLPKELTEEEWFHGYIMGSEIINFLLPPKNCKIEKVEISKDLSEEALKIENGIQAKQIIITQIKDALVKINKNKPKKIITIGGECSTSVPAFTYLINYYKNNIGIVWIDAHPDFNLPGEEYEGFHAMPVSHMLGKGDKDIIDLLPGTLECKDVCYIGLRKMGDHQIKRIKEWNLSSISCEENRSDNNKIINILKEKNINKVLIHLDLDVLDCDEIIAAVGREKNGMSLKEVGDCIKLIEKNFDVVGFTVAEHMPNVQIRIKRLLGSLSLFE